MEGRYWWSGDSQSTPDRTDEASGVFVAWSGSDGVASVQIVGMNATGVGLDAFADGDEVWVGSHLSGVRVGPWIQLDKQGYCSVFEYTDGKRSGVHLRRGANRYDYVGDYDEVSGGANVLGQQPALESDFAAVESWANSRLSDRGFAIGINEQGLVDFVKSDAGMLGLVWGGMTLHGARLWANSSLVDVPLAALSNGVVRWYDFDAAEWHDVNRMGVA